VRAEAIKEDVKSTNRGGRGPSEEAQPPEMDFAGFVLSLSTTAMFHFGDLPDPVTKKAEKNLAAAKQTIDILGMLQEKTAGNLTADEKNILDAVLFELRMRYVKEKSKTKLYSPAKVNLFLEVLGKRDDGYHDLATLMQRISLFDEMEFL